MNVFVAGATGAIGRELVPRLVAAGHSVFGMTRSEERRGLIEELGAVPVVADALDPEAVAEAVARARPDAIVHQLTAIGRIDPRHMERDFAATNRLRTEGTDHLLAAGRAVGVRRIVAQSHIVCYERSGSWIKTEEDGYDHAPPRQARANLEAIRHLEQAVLAATWAEGIVLRYGWFYGPGTSLAPGAEQLELIRRRRLPIVGGGQGRWSFVHVEDAASATVAALQQGSPGVYNICDDDPAAVAEWVPAIAEQLGARRPLRVPRLVGRLAAGAYGVAVMTELRGASNAKAGRELGWHPQHPSWRRSMVPA